MSHLTLIPAYGRDYRTKAEVIAAWFGDKDFLCTGYGGGGYVNRPQVTCDVNIRYDGSRKVVVVPLGMKPPKPRAPKVNKVKVDKPTLRTAYDYESEDAPETFPG